ncbi:thrombospondin type 3 repeat-containing protein [Luteolibacter luteus]|uniref:EF-hand domain-containing protein n=1 Tax=Luteolibacter luteus TaxID=2728835 RepID=A0A858RFL0_9BACT|nr:thrombospondin type 3 repeat-containing protein [Luteolibacter luteus]QJE95229.1 hypothetical protein HHL09_05385 [Luteolibacter luteus]
MRPFLHLAALAAVSLTATTQAQIKNLTSNIQGSCSIIGEGNWVLSYPEGGTESRLYRTEEFPFNFSQTALPPVAKSFSKVLDAPPATTHPGFTWSGGIQPSLNYSFSVPQWATSPGSNGELASANMRFEVNSTVVTGTPDLVSCSTRILIFFELTEPMALTQSGGSFFVSGLTVPLSELLDEDGYLPSGSYVYGLMSHPGTGWVALSLVPPPIDTDGDGLLDPDEVNIHHTDPAKADTDGDGLNDREELQIVHSNPLLADTDGDGFLDGAEWKSGKSPTDPLSFPSAAMTIHPAIELRIVTKLGTNYRVQSSVDLDTWVDTALLIEGTGSEVRRLFESTDDGAKFWRVRVE